MLCLLTNARLHVFHSRRNDMLLREIYPPLPTFSVILSVSQASYSPRISARILLLL